MNNVTIAFALVVLAFSAVAVLSLIYAVSSNSRSKAVQIQWEMSRPAKLAHEVADLVAVVDANKRATRAELGKIWQKFSKLEFTEPADESEAVLATQARQIAATSAVCENWIVAQNPANPGWRDARECECNYCLTARHARNTEKQRILSERSRAKANGSE